MIQRNISKMYVLLAMLVPSLCLGQTGGVAVLKATETPKTLEIPKIVESTKAVEVPKIEAKPQNIIVVQEPSFSSKSKTWGLRPMTESEFTSSMCVLGATASLAFTYMVGPNEIIMLVVGGVVVPSSPSVLLVSLFGTMAAAGCTIGGSSTPAISWLYQSYKAIK